MLVRSNLTAAGKDNADMTKEALIGAVTDHPTVLLVGVGAGLAIASARRVIRRMQRRLMRTAVLALTGGAGAGGTAALVHALSGWW